MSKTSAASAIHILGMIAGILMPVWNIPLMARIMKRKTSKDISLAWLFGVWICILLLLPAALVSTDVVFKAYGISNAILFSAVVVVVMRHRKDS